VTSVDAIRPFRSLDSVRAGATIQNFALGFNEMFSTRGAKEKPGRE
jgi:hypothetical protein